MPLLSQFPQVQLPPKLKKWLPWVYVPVGYIFLFCFFAYLAFPYDRLKERIVLGYNRSQADSPEPKRMEIGKLTWSWRFPGVVMSDVDLISPKPKPDPDAPPDAPAPEQKTVHVDQVYARIAPLSYLFGNTVVTLSVDGFGGELHGTYENSTAATKLDVELEDINPGDLPGVPELLQLPVSGKLSGQIELTLPEGKYSLANGTVELEVSELKLADGKTKVRGLLALPEIDAGTLNIKATATEGRVDLEKFEVKGDDLEAQADGKLRLRDKLEQSMSEQINLSFKFSDKYRDKDDNTRSLLGKPGDAMGGLIDMTPQVKQAKQQDGSYAWRVLGTFSALSFSPSRKGAPAGAVGAAGAPPRPGALSAPSRPGLRGH
ncbi:MAG TPA: type II secretion system protein GspN [Polyangiaceae bacterium]|jgi:type II secretion system protein N|nr:type II secretion system protein GspN [Polyangiaceae bacterium]